MKIVITLLVFLLPLFAAAQKTHTVGPKESLFSIGRLYNVHPKELASYNNIPFEKGLTIGQVIKIPATKTMAPVAETPATAAPQKIEPLAAPVVKAETPKAAPVKKEQAKSTAAMYHTVAKKEGLYSISKKYNVTIEEIKKWNNLSNDVLSEGMNLIVGYGVASNVSVVSAPVQVEKKEPEIVKVSDPKPIVTETKQVAEVPVVKSAPVKMVSAETGNRANVNFNGGVFKNDYTTQVTGKSIKEEKGLAGIFKSNSGWEDGKYYCLHNSAPAGTYIKITNPVTQKSVYAKVLDLIPDLKQNYSVIIRISNAAAAELGFSSNNFDCILNF